MGDAHPTNVLIMNEKIWLIGGTTESVKIAELLWQNDFTFLISVTTNSAKNLYNHIPKKWLYVGKIDLDDITNFMINNQIKIVIDASHPYAVNISQGTIKACETLQIRYLRYERPYIQSKNSGIIEVPNIEYLLEKDQLKNKRVLLTIGYKSLHQFKNYHNQATLFARILPYQESIKFANLAGFNSHQLIAIRPPFSFELEKALWQLWNIDLVVTKASGKSGGEDLKYQVSQALNIPLIVLTRPKINYPFVTSNLQELISTIKSLFDLKC